MGQKLHQLLLVLGHWASDPREVCQAGLGRNLKIRIVRARHGQWPTGIIKNAASASYHVHVVELLSRVDGVDPMDLGSWPRAVQEGPIHEVAEERVELRQALGHAYRALVARRADDPEVLFQVAVGGGVQPQRIDVIDLRVLSPRCDRQSCERC